MMVECARHRLFGAKGFDGGCEKGDLQAPTGPQPLQVNHPGIEWA